MIPRVALALLVLAFQLPPVSWICPMHPDIVQDARGTCPICKMALEPVRLDRVWSCPIHSVVHEKAAGRCPVCGRDLIPVTMAVTWTCAGEAGQPPTTRPDPGSCADGSQAVITYAPQPHGNHNPQHGGVFFMAPDSWHHVEGAYPRAGVFRLYLYDDYSRTLPRDRLRRVAARVETDRSVALVVVSGGQYLEARLPRMKLPAQLTAKVRFKPGEPERRFDFAFEAYSVEPTATATSTSTPTAPLVASGFSRNTASDSKTSPTEVRLKADATRDAEQSMLLELRARAKQIADAIGRRAFSEVWVPALEAKDIALAIEAHAADAAAPHRRAISAAVKGLVRAAWLLDAYGDLGNAQQIGDAHTQFVEAMKQLEAAVRLRSK